MNREKTKNPGKTIATSNDADPASSTLTLDELERTTGGMNVNGGAEEPTSAFDDGGFGGGDL